MHTYGRMFAHRHYRQPIDSRSLYDGLAWTDVILANFFPHAFSNFSNLPAERKKGVKFLSFVCGSLKSGTTGPDEDKELPKLKRTMFNRVASIVCVNNEHDIRRS